MKDVFVGFVSSYFGLGFGAICFFVFVLLVGEIKTIQCPVITPFSHFSVVLLYIIENVSCVGILQVRIFINIS